MPFFARPVREALRLAFTISDSVHTYIPVLEMIHFYRFVAFFIAVVGVEAFSGVRSQVGNQHNHGLITATTTTTRSTTRPSHGTTLFSEPEKKKRTGLDTAMRSKLVTESIAPWRTLRLFLYGSLGSGAFIGGLINISGAVAGSNRPDFNLNTEVMRCGMND